MANRRPNLSPVPRRMLCELLWVEEACLEWEDVEVDQEVEETLTGLYYMATGAKNRPRAEAAGRKLRNAGLIQTRPGMPYRKQLPTVGGTVAWLTNDGRAEANLIKEEKT
jgi:hypothetical protein